MHPSLSLDSYTSTNPLAKAVCAHQSLQEEQGENEQTRTKMENEERNVSRGGKKKWVAKNKQASKKKLGFFATAHEHTLAKTHVSGLGISSGFKNGILAMGANLWLFH